MNPRTEDDVMCSSELRRLAVDVGYRMLGTHADAEDIAQEALARVLDPIERGDIDNPEAYTTTVATRLALDELKSARRRRECYVGPWLPEPRVDLSTDPVEVADDVSYALLVVMDSLSPLERAAFLLREAFGFGYDSIGEAIDRTPAASRQLVSRARRHVRARQPQTRPDPEVHRALVEQFLLAATGGDIDQLIGVLATDVELVNDGGPRRKAARYPIRGRTRVARYLANVFPRLLDRRSVSLATVNGDLGFAIREGGRVHMVGVIDGSPRIRRISWVLNPDKL